MRLRGEHRRRLVAAALGAIVAGSSALLALGTSRVHEWVVMTDELLYAKLARHVGTTGSPLPTIHGEHVGFLGVVYPILLSPLYGSLDPVSAFDAAHVLNAVLFASAAIPAYLLARRVARAPSALAVAALTVAVPWSLNAAFVMSEPAAYPVFLWAVLACHRAAIVASPRHDLVAVAALVVAYFTRPQLAFLALALPPTAIVVLGPRRAVREHRVLAGAYGLGVAVVVALAAAGEAHRLLGDYGVTATEGSLLPAIAWKSAALHLDTLAIGLGVVPFLLGAGWAYASLRQPRPELRALAALTAFGLPLLALETASYDVRFGGPAVIRDRYLFYLAPLLFACSATLLAGKRLPLVGVAAATAFFTSTVPFAALKPVPGILVDSPESVLNGLIHDESGGLPAGVFVAVCGVLLGLACLALHWVPRVAAALGVGVVVFSFCGGVSGYAFERLLTSTSPAGLPVTGRDRVRDWVDRVTDGPAALVPAPISRAWSSSAVQWWEVEFWNDDVVASYVGPDGHWTYTPFPSRTLRLDRTTGRFAGTEDAPPYVVVSQTDPRFALAGRQAAANVGLRVLAAERPYRALWASSGLDPDGWTRPGRPASIRVYGAPGGGARRLRVDVALAAPPEATEKVAYRVGDEDGSVAPGAVATASVERCVPANGHVDVRLASGRAATIAGPPFQPTPAPPRDVGVALSGVEVTPGEPCS